VASNEIIFLGTAGGRWSVSKQLRASGGIILKVNNVQFHIDPGPGALVKAKEYGINLRQNSVLLCSHAHLDHCNDVNAVVDAMTNNGLDKKGILIASKSVIHGDDKEKPYLTKLHKNSIDKCIALGPGNEVKFGDIELKTLRTKHRDTTTIGFKFISDELKISYSSDTAFFNGLIDEYVGSDILILNNLKPFGHKSDDHLSSDDSVRIIKEVSPKLAIIQHFGEKMLEQNPVYQARDIQNKTNVQVIAAKDGMLIDLVNRSTSFRQRHNFY